MTDEFGENNYAGSPVPIFFGVEGVDDSEESQWDPEWNNDAIFDKGFTIKPQAN